MSSPHSEIPTPEGVSALKRRLSLHGDAWTRALIWGVRNVPPPLEPFLLAFWSTVFFLVAGRQRRAIAENMRVLFPRDSLLEANAKAWRVFWNFANTEVEAVHCLELNAKFDWEVEGREHFDELANAADGAMILTAHMSNYDVAAFLFANRLRKPLHTVRAPEATPELQALKDEERRRLFAGQVKIHYNTQADDALGLELLRALQAGDVVAIQGDRLIGGAAMAAADFGGVPVTLPNGPFALASIAKCRVFPLFIVRLGRRRYRIVCQAPITVTRERQLGARRHQFQSAMDIWGGILAGVARKYWFQWYVFEPMFAPGSRWPGDPRPPRIEQLPRDAAECAPSRCTTALVKLGAFLALKLRPRVAPAPLNYLAGFLSSGADMYRVEAPLYSMVVPLALAGLFAGWLEFAGWAPGWSGVLWGLLSPVWLPVLVHFFLVAIFIALVPVRAVLRPGHALRHRLHWWGIWIVLAGISLWALGVMFKAEVVQAGWQMGWGLTAAWLASMTVVSLVGQNAMAAAILLCLPRAIAKLEATLPLNKLPEQLGNGRKSE